jgi:AraC family transcriptional regulator
MGQFEVELKRGERWQTEHYRLGDIGIFPAHQPHPQARCDRGVELIQLYLEPQVMAQVTDHSLEALVDIVPQHKIRDPLIQQIGLTLKTELELGGPSSCFYADAMATALSAHLLQRYSTQRSPLQEYTGGLSSHKLKQAIAYIQDHLDRDLRLTEIAASVQISPHYFATLFKQSTGLAPHQFVTQCRIERAKGLLTRQELTILEILPQVGFKSQSHFTRVFREQTGLTPTAYRNHT